MLFTCTETEIFNPYSVQYPNIGTQDPVGYDRASATLKRSPLFTGVSPSYGFDEDNPLSLTLQGVDVYAVAKSRMT